MKISIVTDSTCDLPEDLVQQYEIQVVPNLVIFDGRSFRDGLDISRQEFYERMASSGSPLTTATASSGTYQEIYQRLLTQGTDFIISMHPPISLSGIFNAASIAAAVFSGKVKVLDSTQLTLGQGFQVLEAAKAAAAGVELPRILNIIQIASRRARVVAMLDTLEYVRRSGRVSWARARLGTFLQIKPFVEVRNGQVLSRGEVRTRNKGVIRLKEFLQELGRLERLAILHTNAEDEARNFLSDLNPHLPTEPLIVNVTTVIGTHVGPNGLGFAALIAE
jgi:DegV family protein with EDD domain